ncbi:MAG: hypothetical protein ACYC26_11065 [Phycisphaerales bacterium]
MAQLINGQYTREQIEAAIGRPLTYGELLGFWWGRVVEGPGLVGAVAKAGDYYGQFANDTLGFTPISDGLLGAYEVAAPAVAAAWDWKKWIIGGGLVLLVIYLLGRLK